MTARTLALAGAEIRDADLTSGLIVRVSDIEFSNVRPDLVDVRITVRNIAHEPSPPTIARICAAPLGAFVPWRLLAIAKIPSLAPDESNVLRVEAQETPHRPLGSADRVPPSRVLTALGQDDENQPLRPATKALASAPPFATSAASTSVTVSTLPTDLLKLLGQGSVHFAGNLNIFIGGRAVERHRAQSLRVYPGRTNLAMFLVGSRPDAYAFDLQGSAAAWDAVLFNTTIAKSFVPGGDQAAIPLRRWIEQSGMSMMVLALRPPKNCEQGTVDVHVKQRSTGETALVEFSLDPAAAGPGCYTL
jgi:hypothetical protein